MRLCAIILAVTLGLVALPVAATPIIDNDHIYCWGDSFGDQFDNYAEVEPGDTIVLQLWLNDLNGSVDLLTGETLVNQDWVRAATGIVTGVWWTPGVVNGGSTWITTTGTYFDGWGLANQFVASNYRESESYYRDVEGVCWVAEGRHIVNIQLPILPDAPIGPTKLGLACLLEWWSSETFFKDKIDVEEPYAMTLNIIPEPATVGMLAVGAAALLRRRRLDQITLRKEQS
jgi:hypothetical protein